jgi:hypothetical protein
MASKDIIYTLVLLSGSILFFYIGYNMMFKAKDFVAKYERAVRNGTKRFYLSSRKGYGDFIYNKLIAFVSLMMSLILLIVFITQLICLLKREETIFHII